MYEDNLVEVTQKIPRTVLIKETIQVPVQTIVQEPYTFRSKRSVARTEEQPSFTAVAKKNTVNSTFE